MNTGSDRQRGERLSLQQPPDQTELWWISTQAFVNQRKLHQEVKTLQAQAAQFAKQAGQWIGMVENFSQELREIGDVENWARSIELDMLSPLSLSRSQLDSVVSA
ncbi:hypothetical protein U0070_009788 [Myodes glareolus]|uniref:Biogenesis of lysosome-related organelles complex 1 subunit 1 n=1 Tax=Myodes glareolus TaxID=447135 RepID=A0AAW0HU48_MYOGA